MHNGEWQLRIWGQFSDIWHLLSVFSCECLACLIFHLCRMSPSYTSPIPSSFWTWWRSWQSRTCPCFISPQGWRRHWRSSSSRWRQLRRICKLQGSRGPSLPEWMILIFYLKLRKRPCTFGVFTYFFLSLICSFCPFNFAELFSQPSFSLDSFTRGEPQVKQ